MQIKTGSVYFRAEDGALMLAESFEDDNGEVVTQQTMVEPAPIQEPLPDQVE